MSLQVRGVTTSSNGTIAVPSGVVAGDYMFALLRSFRDDEGDPTPFDPPAGWTTIDNTQWGSPTSLGNRGGRWGVGTFVREVDGTESADYTWAAPASDNLFGGIVAVYSDAAYSIEYIRSGTNSGPFGSSWQTWFVPSMPAGSLFIHMMSGNGTAATSYSGFTGTRTDYGAWTLHSDEAHADEPNPLNFTGFRDMAAVLNVESGTLNWGDRIAQSNYVGPPANSGYWSNTIIRLQEGVPLSPSITPWQVWIID